MDGARPRILFVDAYDSFANNITALLATLLDADVHVLPIDAVVTKDAFYAELAYYDAVVCGPGPGSPDCPADIGLMKYVWANDSNIVTPALGICLGFQSLVAAFGGRIRRLRSGGLHGMVRPVEVNEDAGDIFSDVAAPFRATLYHSLGADIGQDDVCEADWFSSRWKTTQASPDLVPLAWVEERTETVGVERLLMGVRHRTQPYWGLQYHPESVCTDAASHAVLANWFREAMQWNIRHSRVRAEPSATSNDGLVARQATRPNLLSMQPPVFRHEANGHGINGTNGTNGTNGANGTNGTSKHTAFSHPSPTRFVSRTIPLPGHVEVPDLVEALQAGQIEGSEPEQIILDSASAALRSNTSSSDTINGDNDTANDEAIRGRFSIIALDVGTTLRVEYRTGDRFATIKPPSKTAVTVSLRGDQTIWQLLAEFHEARRLSPAETSETVGRPFLGGFMGYISYEQGLGDIGVPLPDAGIDGGGRGHDRPDVCFAWVTRSIVVDHVLGVVHVQHLEGSDENIAKCVDGTKGTNGVNGTHINGKSQANGMDGKVRPSWVAGVVARLQASTQWKGPAKKVIKTASHPQVVSTQLPDVQAYEDKVRMCQEHIAAGDSYELCLTDETRITTASPSSSSPSWHYYRTLRKKNPSPFASYIRIGGATLVSSSPERFLSFSSNSDTGNTLCSMRPMKGTVRRSEAVATLAEAEAVLHVPKEEAENLMIVDLVRHDLHGVCGPGHVTVPRLLQVEPYGHVFQMVTVVEGELAAKRAGSKAPGYTGLDVLAASLPPGSMTGAPKKRSCALLQAMEKQPTSPRSLPGQRFAPGERSLYSGVVGYLCVTGRGDWSVTIRSLFRWDDETTFSDDKATRNDVWHIGAGGAVTILSTPEGERDEMFVKLSGPLGTFDL
ncbi:hypothetical protein SEUCBS140593_003810 [Sporothrix eucalyptigena]|uniref:aminodeoxychorismate synthase n=1 Tax=Sporothrix eucalyptigena TaxID=1812306 RepID=A0ABP0BHX9_9PEZI